MENDAIVVSSLRESREVLTCLWRMVCVELDGYGALKSLSSVFEMEEVIFTIVVSSATFVAILNANEKLSLLLVFQALHLETFN